MAKHAKNYFDNDNVDKDECVFTIQVKGSDVREYLNSLYGVKRHGVENDRIFNVDDTDEGGVVYWEFTGDGSLDEEDEMMPFFRGVIEKLVQEDGGVDAVREAAADPSSLEGRLIRAKYDFRAVYPFIRKMRCVAIMTYGRETYRVIISPSYCTDALDIRKFTLNESVDPEPLVKRQGEWLMKAAREWLDAHAQKQDDEHGDADE